MEPPDQVREHDREKLAEVLTLAVIGASRRLIEHQEPRFGRKRSDERYSTQSVKWEVRGGPSEDIGNSEGFDKRAN
jgi:hypothetical protein